MKLLLLRGALFLFVMVLYGQVGRIDLESAEVTAAIAEEVEQEVETLRAQLAMPLRCDAIVAQRGAGEKWKARCYTRPENR